MTLLKYRNVKLSVILSVLAIRGRGFSVICTGWKTSILFIWRCACVTQQWLCHGWFIVVAVGSKQKSLSFHATIPDQFCIIHFLLGINTHFRLIHSLYLTQAQIFGPCPPLYYPCVSDSRRENNKHTHLLSRELLCEASSTLPCWQTACQWRRAQLWAKGSATTTDWDGSDEQPASKPVSQPSSLSAFLQAH